MITQTPWVMNNSVASYDSDFSTLTNKYPMATIHNSISSSSADAFYLFSFSKAHSNKSLCGRIQLALNIVLVTLIYVSRFV